MSPEAPAPTAERDRGTEAPDPRLARVARQLGLTVAEAVELYPPERLAAIEAMGARPGEGALALLKRRTEAEALIACPSCARDSCAGDCPDLGATRAYPVRDFLALTLPPRRSLLIGPSGAPILREKDLGMVFAPRGLGKTWMTGGLALAVATRGRFLKWQAVERRRVLLVDGEMPAGALQERLRLLLASVEPQEQPDLLVLAADVQDEPMASLASPGGQARIEEHLDGVALVILDNISTLMGVADENDAAQWEPAQAWLLSLRRRGLAVLMAHHAGRAGHARGTSRREDVLDLVMRLSRPSDYAPDQGARFEVSFEKARGFEGQDAETFEAWLRGGDWILSDVTSAKYEQALELFSEGAKSRDVAEALGVGRATAFRYQRQGRREGRLEPLRKRAK